MLRSLLLGSIALLPLTAASVPKSTNVIVADRVEEDWQLVLDVPISDLSCPQITTLMMVDETGTFPTAVFNMNYRDLPAFNSGVGVTNIGLFLQKNDRASDPWRDDYLDPATQNFQWQAGVPGHEWAIDNLGTVWE